MKQISPVKDEKGIMLKQAKYYRDYALIRTETDRKYGEEMICQRERRLTLSVLRQSRK